MRSFSVPPWYQFSIKKHSKGLKELSVSERDQTRETFGEFLAERLSKGSDPKIYVDLHYCDIREDPDKLLHPASFLSIVNYFVLMTADPETIQKRRLTDTTRDRALDLGKIRAEQDAELKCATKLANAWHKPVVKIDAMASVPGIISSLLKISKD